ncbi:hypothetical protein FUAX_53820 (plasmid) [Fulvitalea axinellae]|uniref:CRISPR system Cms protein Csm2 n=1 Tax=Fulvitalea axinellae TaxID=1182444 RepID=A0AAU9CV70_9BACT|nr:hypothetical protein FUAX_53820 [Fulvitalea axinellae]
MSHNTNKANGYDRKRGKDIFSADPMAFARRDEKAVKAMGDLEEDVKTRFGKDKKGYITPTQLRNIYDLVKRCGDISELQLLRPKLLYTAARQNKEEGKRIILAIAQAVKSIEGTEGMKAFKTFMEATVAYHKYYFPADKG